MIKGSNQDVRKRLQRGKSDKNAIKRVPVHFSQLKGYRNCLCRSQFIFELGFGVSEEHTFFTCKNMREKENTLGKETKSGCL